MAALLGMRYQNANTMTDDVVRGKFVRRKPMPLYEDSAPPKRPTAAQ
jgi:hypothetical protein